MSLRIPAYDGLAGEENPLGRLQAPSHWRRSRIKNFFRESDLRRGDKHLPLLSLTRLRGLILHSDATAKAASAEDHSKYKVCHPGWLVMNRMQAWSGMFSAASLSGIVSPDYSVFELTDPDECVEFFESLFKSPRYVDQFAALSKGIGSGFNRLYTPEFGSIPVFVPPPDEQAQIVRFIRHLDHRVNRLIKTKRRLIELLNEQKQAIIHRAVTRGLDPTVPLKGSGIDWLGDVNASWQVLRSKYLFREVDERSVDGAEEHLSMSQVHGLIPSSKISEKRLVSESYAGGKICRKGDLVLNRLKAHLGVFALAPMLGVISPDYTVLRPIADIEERFFELVYRTPACRVELAKRAKGIVQGFWRLYTDDFYCIGVPVPPRSEQKQILDWLDAELKTLNDAIQKSFAEIDLIREYRTRLVADVVTGQLDVRNLDLPEVEESLIEAIDSLEEDLVDPEETLAESDG